MNLHVCCNDWRNGIFTGKVSAIEVASLNLECRFLDWQPRITEGDGFIRIGGRKLRCSGSKYGIGNWCWNGYKCDAEDVLALLNWPKFRTWFDLTEAPEKVFDAYRAGRNLRLVARKEAVASEAVAQ